MQPLNYKTAAAAVALISTMLNLFSRDSWHVRGEKKRLRQLNCLFQFNRAE